MNGAGRAEPHPRFPMNTPKSPWRRLKAELAREDFLPYPVQDEFASLKEASFDFLMNIIERREGTPRQLRNALLMASIMRGWGRTRLILALPSLCTHEDFKVRSTALQILLGWLDLTRSIPGERIDGYDEQSFQETIHKALALGVAKNIEDLARIHLARTG